MILALAFNQIFFSDKSLVPDAVKPAVFFFVNIARINKHFPHFLRSWPMPFFVGSSDKIIPRKIKNFAKSPKFSRIFIYQFLRSFPFFLRLSHDLCPMLVRPSQKSHFPAMSAMKSG